jgi:hypothetical protein
MLKQELKISVISIDQGDSSVHFKIEASNGINSISQDFYGYADNFKKFENGLISFPKTITDNVKYGLGEKGDRWAYYILLDGFCHANYENAAIPVLIDNNEKQPNKIKVNFTLRQFLHR